MLIVHAKDHVVSVMDRGGPIGCMRTHNITGAADEWRRGGAAAGRRTGSGRRFG